MGIFKKLASIFLIGSMIGLAGCEGGTNVTLYLPPEFFQDISEDISAHENQTTNKNKTSATKEVDVKIKDNLNTRETIDEFFSALKDGRYEYANAYLLPNDHLSENGVVIKGNVFMGGELDDETRDLLDSDYKNLEYEILNIKDPHDQTAYADIKVSSGSTDIQRTVTLKQIDGTWRILLDKSFAEIITPGFLNLSNILENVLGEK